MLAAEWRRKNEFARLVLQHSLASALTVSLFLVLLYHFFVVADHADDVLTVLTATGGARSLIIVFAMYAVPAGALYLLWKRSSAFPSILFILCYLLWAAFLCALYLRSADPAYVSDFLRMWEAASRFDKTGLQPVRGIIEQRALFVLYPIVEVFGARPLALEIANSIIYAAIGLIGYDVLRRQHSHRAAQAFSLVWLTSFEPLMAIGIPTHDLWGVLFISGALWALCRTQEAITHVGLGWRTSSWMVLTGVLLALLQAQREIGVVLLLASVLVLVYWGLGRALGWRTALAAPVILVVVFFAMTGAMSSAGVLAPKTGQEQLNTARIAGFATSFSSGRFTYGVAVRDTFLKPLDDDASRNELAHSIFLSDITSQPAQRLPNFLTRLRALAQPGSQMYFYMAEVPSKTTARARVAALASACWVFGVGLLAVFSILRRKRGEMLSAAAVMAMFAGGMILAFCAVSEVQPRYAFFMWFVTAMLVADGLFAVRTVGDATSEEAEHVRFPIWTGKLRFPLAPRVSQFATALVLGGLAWIAVSLVYSPARGRILSGWQYEVVQEQGAIDDVEVLIDSQHQNTQAFSHLELPANQASSFGALAMSLEFPSALSNGDSIIAWRTVCAGEMDAVSFYFSTPYKNLPKSGAFKLSFAQNGNTLWSEGLPAAELPVLVRVPLQNATGCSRLEFELVSNVAIEVESWRRASRVEIIFPRLVKTR